MADPETFDFLNGTFVVHRRQDCTGPCPIHNPSLHPMVEEPMILRETNLIERQCHHGVGHPDPDSLAYLNEHGLEGQRGSWGVHGCCGEGCCTKMVTDVTERGEL
jgi:hypothetical protein